MTLSIVLFYLNNHFNQNVIIIAITFNSRPISVSKARRLACKPQYHKPPSTIILKARNETFNFVSLYNILLLPFDMCWVKGKL